MNNQKDSLGRKQGPWIFEYSDCIDYVNYIDDKAHGLLNRVVNNKQVLCAEYVNGTPNGFFKKYRKNENLMYESFVINTLFEGEYISYDR